MRSLSCDVLIIGAGPAGSSAALSSAKEGLDVIIVDKKDLPSKTACAETISKGFFRYLPFKIPDRLLKHRLRGIKFYYEEFFVKRDKGIWWKSFTIDRREFDPFVLNLAIDEGATFLASTEFVDLRYSSGYIVNKVLLRDNKNNELTIYPKIFIAADGAQSSVLNAMNLSKNKAYSIGYIKSHEFHNLDLSDYEYGHVYFGEFADGAYGYIFPKSRNVANIGVASLTDKELDKRYKEFLHMINREIGNGTKKIDRSGIAPIMGLSEDIAYGNTLLVGDAANQNLKPFVEGILPGIICGSIAGQVAAQCLNDIRNIRRFYKELIKKKIGKFFKESDALSDILVNIYDKRYRSRFLIELATFSYTLEYGELQKLLRLNEEDIETLLKEKLA